MSGSFTRKVIWSGKIIICGICFYAGVILGSIVASALGIASPPLPAGIDGMERFVAQPVAQAWNKPVHSGGRCIHVSVVLVTNGDEDFSLPGNTG